jgi:hypothetical protein
MTQEKEYPLESLIFPEDLKYIRKIYPTRVPHVISGWIANEKREKDLAKNPPKPEKALIPEALAVTVKEGLDKVASGNISDVENQLATQVIVLQQIFQVYTQKMVNDDYSVAQKIYGELALKAQSQARKTLNALVQLKDRRNKNDNKQTSEN